MIFQDPMTSLNPVLTIGRQIRETLETHFDMNRKEAEARAAELIDRVGIPSAKARLRDYPHQFSGGMRQRAMIAMALACEPKLLIADEPTTALDVTIQAQILDLLRELVAEENAALILITHDLGVVAGNVRARERDVRGHVHGDRLGRAALRHAAPPVHARPAPERPAPRRWAGRRGCIRSRARRRTCSSAPTACPFQPRCRYEVDLSSREVPPLVEIEPGHKVACFNPVPLDEWDRTREAATA